MVNRISPGTRKAILDEFLKGSSSKAAIAKKYGVSTSTVTRIVSSESPSQTEPAATKAAKESGKVEALAKKLGTEGISENEIDEFISLMKETEGTSDVTGLFKEFVDWVKSRDELEKERLNASMEVDSLKSEKASIENEIFNLGSKAATLEIVIGKMKALAENSQESMSLVEERLTNLEERLAEDRDLLIIASGIKSLIDRGDIDDETLAFIMGFDNLWAQNEAEIREKASKALIRYIEMANSKVKSFRR